MEKHVYNQLRTHRREKKWTQEVLATKVGVTRQTIIAIEKGDYTPSVSLALRLSRQLEVPVEAIFSLSKFK